MRISLAAAALLGVLILATAAAFAPYLYPEYELRVQGMETAVLPRPEQPVSGRWFDDYFVIEDVDARTYAIGEPRYYQGNYSYLLLGDRRAILFDAGTGTRDIVPVVRSLTPLPVTVIPSHLHFDHVGALGRFERTALLADPRLEARASSGSLTLGRYEFLGFVEHLPAPTFRVDEWWASGSTVDLGGRRVLVLGTPGHTPTSVSLYDPEAHEAFVGDFVYPGNLYAFLPGASRSAYLSTTRKLLGLLDPRTRLFTAHMADPPAPIRAPVLAVDDLRALEAALVSLDHGTLAVEPHAEFPRAFGFPRVFHVSQTLKLVTGFSWNNR